jgi:hypothetical protein
MQLARIQIMEHCAFSSALSLHALCDEIRRHFGLPEFEYDSENMTEWGTTEQDGLEYNISRPFEEGTLQEWDGSVPPGCNVGVSLSVSRGACEPAEAERFSMEITSRFAQEMADLLAVSVHHHGTWLGPGKNITRSRVFQPKSQESK